MGKTSTILSKHLHIVKEEAKVFDMSFLKSVKSKVDCWGGSKLTTSKLTKHADLKEIDEKRDVTVWVADEEYNPILT